MAEGFFGYLAPLGQHVILGQRQVIVSLAGAIPFVGDSLWPSWVRGDFNMSGVTLNRFFRPPRRAGPISTDCASVFAHVWRFTRWAQITLTASILRKTLTENGQADR